MKTKWKRRLSTLCTIALTMLFVTVSTASANSAKAPESDVDPANFVSQVDNEFFPLPPGTTFHYEGSSEGIPTSEDTFVTHNTREILGIDCTVVHTQTFEGGVLVEDTFDWYAQDVAGNVWYFGEDTKELDANGNVISTEGSWEAGVNGAQPGIIMEADPKKGDRYQQEDAPDIAEDMAQVRSLDESICVSYGCFENVLSTKEWSSLDKGVTENKYYAKGIGFIFGVMVKGGDEKLELVSITH